MLPDSDKDGEIVASSEIVEEKNYYPFGLKHKGYNGLVSNGNVLAQKFGFNGKEEVDDFGLNWYDYGARNYNASIGRWMNVDPLAETPEQFNKSPYAFAWNSPLMYIDPNGLYPIKITTRSFAPFKAFGPGNKWHGDNRGYSSDLNASYRTSATVNYDTETNISSASGGKSYSSTLDGSKAAWSETYVENRSEGNNLDVHSYGNNAAQFGSPDIDQFTKLEVTLEGDINGDHILNVSGTISGDDFPNQESLITDSEGNTLWLGNFETSASGEWGPVKNLWRENEKDINISVNISISVDINGVFNSVLHGGETISIEDWNKQFEKNGN